MLRGCPEGPGSLIRICFGMGEYRIGRKGGQEEKTKKKQRGISGIRGFELIGRAI
jgi:hypothetical protein